MDQDDRRSFEFTGSEELRAAEVMENYNRDIASIFRSAWDKASRGRDVLDFGAGIGSITTEFFSQTGVKPITLEIDKELAEIVRTRGFQVIDRIEAVEAASKDLVFSSNVLEHIQDDTRVIKQIFAVLRTGGVFAIYVPAFPSLYTKYDEKIGHVRRYTRRDLVAKVAAAGFLIEEVSYRDSLGFIAALAFKILAGDRPQAPSIRQLRAYDKLYPTSRLLDRCGLSKVIGKNLCVIARKPPL